MTRTAVESRSTTAAASSRSGSAVVRAWQTPGRQHGQRAAANLAPAPPQQNPIVPAVMRLPATPSVADDCHLAASRTLPRQPLGIVLAELASITGTWDKDDHGREGTPRNRYPAKAHDSAAPPSLLSIRIYAEKESHPALFEIGRFTVTKISNLNSPSPHQLSQNTHPSP